MTRGAATRPPLLGILATLAGLTMITSCTTPLVPRPTQEASCPAGWRRGGGVLQPDRHGIRPGVPGPRQHPGTTPPALPRLQPGPRLGARPERHRCVVGRQRQRRTRHDPPGPLLHGHLRHRRFSGARTGHPERDHHPRRRCRFQQQPRQRGRGTLANRARNPGRRHHPAGPGHHRVGTPWHRTHRHRDGGPHRSNRGGATLHPLPDRDAAGRPPRHGFTRPRDSHHR